MFRKLNEHHGQRKVRRKPAGRYHQVSSGNRRNILPTAAAMPLLLALHLELMLLRLLLLLLQLSRRKK
jgi:hypothetical protein